MLRDIARELYLEDSKDGEIDQTLEVWDLLVN